jgi:hypothetical protein
VDTTNPNVLVGVTDGHEIDAALDYAAAAAMRRGCGVHLVHVQHPGHLGRSAAVDLRMIDGDVRMARVEVLGRAASHVEKHVDDRPRQHRAGPRRSSLVAASQTPAWSSCRTTASGYWPGVRAVGDEWCGRSRARTRGGHPASWQRPDAHPGTVAVGVEEARSSDDVVCEAFDEARRTHSGVRLVQCW